MPTTATSVSGSFEHQHATPHGGPAFELSTICERGFQRPGWNAPGSNDSQVDSEVNGCAVGSKRSTRMWSFLTTVWAAASFPGATDPS